MSHIFHTLLPLHERKILRREYRFRLVIVLCFLISVAGIVGTGSLFPAFVHAVLAERDAENSLILLTKDKKGSTVADVERNLNANKALLVSLTDSTHGQDFSFVVQTIVGLRGPIRINSAMLAKMGTSTATVTIGGIAPTRDSLLAFKSRLESIASGHKVSFPVSVLAKSTNIQFSIQITTPLP